MDSVRTPAKKDALDDRSVERKSARAMFNGIESGSNAAVGSASQATRPDDQAKRLAAAGKATEVASSKPLGLRYSFVARDTDGRERVVDAVTAAKSAGAGAHQRGSESGCLPANSPNPRHCRHPPVVASTGNGENLTKSDCLENGMRLPCPHRQRADCSVSSSVFLRNHLRR